MAADDIYRHIGRRVREERLHRDWTQEQLAEKIDAHLSFIGQIERGLKKPSLKTLKALADAFGIRAGDLLDEAQPARQPHPLERRFTELLRDRPTKQQESLYRAFRELARHLKRTGS